MSSRYDADTAAPFRLSKERSVSMPIAFLGALVVVTAVGYAAWSGTQDQVKRNTGDIGDLKKDAKAAREILIRIDENVKNLNKK